MKLYLLVLLFPVLIIGVNGCGKFEMWHQCSNCDPTCGRPFPECPSPCVPGCVCRPGFVREPLPRYRCVPITSCKPDYDLEDDFGCGPNQEYSDCRGCTFSCNNTKGFNCPESCRPGCQCLVGHVRDAQGVCIAFLDCPKHEEVVNSEVTNITKNRTQEIEEVLTYLNLGGKTATNQSAVSEPEPTLEPTLEPVPEPPPSLTLDSDKENRASKKFEDLIIGPLQFLKLGRKDEQAENEHQTEESSQNEDGDAPSPLGLAEPVQAAGSDEKSENKAEPQNQSEVNERLEPEPKPKEQLHCPESDSYPTFCNGIQMKYLPDSFCHWWGFAESCARTCCLKQR